MEAFLGGKRKADHAGCPEQGKAARLPPAGASAPEPLVLITWNANGASPREKDDAAIAAFMAARKPDVLLVQEVRLKAAGRNQRDRPLPSERGSRLFIGSTYSSTHTRHLSLGDAKSAGTMALVRSDIEHAVHSSWHAALSALGAEAGSLSGFACEPHHPEGRMQYLVLPSFDCLHTYVHNSGSTTDSIARRARWDADVERFLRARAALTTRPLVWAGDLNVAHTPHDSTDEAFFRKLNQPGFLDGERARFSRLLDAGGLVDVWRARNPVSATPPPRTSAAFTWRGALRGANKSGPARFEGKAMRIDYVCASAAFCEARVAACEILGHGTERVGFLGSDHAPLMLTLKPSPT